ncbi:MAG: glycosyltransferase [Candidatus Woesebacteria bacterium]|jgi:GT2 family glycosyltransferase
MIKDLPQQQLLVSVIVVNFNGKHFLKRCFDSLLTLNFPKDKYEIIMVDNASHDLSVDYVQKKYPQIKIIKSKSNLGFTGGNNLAAKYAKGKYLALLNNDTQVDKNWLKYLVQKIKSDPKIAAVNSKALLAYPMVELKINSDVYMKSEFSDSTNFQSVGVLIEDIILENNHLKNLIYYRKGFIEKERGTIPARWTSDHASILIPCELSFNKLKFSIIIRSQKLGTNLETKLSLKIGQKHLIKDSLKSHEVMQYDFEIPRKDIEKNFLYYVQNAGSIVFKTGHGRDRGAVVRDHQQSYEIDNPFYNKATELTAFCGVSVIIRKDLFLKYGGFDDSFFMYYEDTDLSLKLKRDKYRIVFEPKSFIYHIHAGSSREWSTFFIYNVEKNHLAFLIKHFPVTIFCRQCFIYITKTTISFLKMLKNRLIEKWQDYEVWRDITNTRVEVIIWFFKNFPKFVKERIKLNQSLAISIKEIHKTLY